MLVGTSAVLATSRLVRGDRRSHGNIEVGLRPGVALLLATVLAWGTAITVELAQPMQWTEMPAAGRPARSTA